MTFGTWLFTAFVTLTVVAYWLVPRPARPWLLLAASYVFYAWAFPPYAVLLAIITVLAWLAGNRAAAGLEAMAHRRRRRHPRESSACSSTRDVRR